jgi:hypothetical protein
MIDMASSGANDGVEQKGGIIDDSLGIGYESRMCEARPDFLNILHRLIAPALPSAFLHSITSSARAMSVGWQRDAERALAVLRLMISAVFVALLSQAKLAKLSLIF